MSKTTEFKAIEAIKSQAGKGLKEYGVGLEGANLSVLELMDHAIEEAADQLMYLIQMKETFLSQNSTYNNAENPVSEN